MNVKFFIKIVWHMSNINLKICNANLHVKTIKSNFQQYLTNSVSIEMYVRVINWFYFLMTIDFAVQIICCLPSSSSWVSAMCTSNFYKKQFYLWYTAWNFPLWQASEHILYIFLVFYFRRRSQCITMAFLWHVLSQSS